MLLGRRCPNKHNLFRSATNIHGMTQAPFQDLHPPPQKKKNRPKNENSSFFVPDFFPSSLPCFNSFNFFNFFSSQVLPRSNVPTNFCFSSRLVASFLKTINNLIMAKTSILIVVDFKWRTTWFCFPPKYMPVFFTFPFLKVLHCSSHFISTHLKGRAYPVSRFPGELY